MDGVVRSDWTSELDRLRGGPSFPTAFFRRGCLDLVIFLSFSSSSTVCALATDRTARIELHIILQYFVDLFGIYIPCLFLRSQRLIHPALFDYSIPLPP